MEDIGRNCLITHVYVDVYLRREYLSTNIHMTYIMALRSDAILLPLDLV